jgi:hypothetical protein
VAMAFIVGAPVARDDKPAKGKGPGA